MAAPDFISVSFLAVSFALVGCVGAAASVPPHEVRPKATADHPAFAREALVLPDGAILAYYVRPGTGATLVLIPETHGDRTQFYEPTFLEHLPAEMRLIVIETRGQGRSWPPASAPQASIEQYATDVLGVVQRLGLSAWHVGGHSLGGMIALEIAGRRPPGLRGVIALEGWAHHRVQRNAFPRISRTETEQAEARRQREERYKSQRWNPEETAALGRIWTAWEAGERILRETAYPVLSVWGDRAMTHRPTRSQLLLPDSAAIELRWIPGADHYITDPPFAADVAHAIRGFIDRVERSAPPGGRKRSD